MNHEVNPVPMQKGPLITLAVVFAAVLLALSFVMVLVPDFVEMASVIAGVVALLAIVVLLVMFLKTRKI